MFSFNIARFRLNRLIHLKRTLVYCALFAHNPEIYMDKDNDCVVVLVVKAMFLESSNLKNYYYIVVLTS